MSKRRSSKKSNDDLLAGLLNGRGPLGIIGVILIAIIGFFVITQNQPSAPLFDSSNDESISGESGRAEVTAIPGLEVPDLGSGAAAKTDWYEVHFNAPSYPDNKAKHTGGLDTYLVSLMNRATSTLDVADYDFDLANVADAMVAAKKRGVQVRMVTDSDTVANKKDEHIQSALKKLSAANITIVEDNRGPIMHNKFTVVDREWVQTGSWNYTDGDTYRLNNHLIIIRDRKLAENYIAEFEKMFVKKQFGPSKDKGVPNPNLTISGSKVQNYFSPQDGVANRIIDTIKTARQSVYFMAFSFTHDGIGGAMTDKAKAGLKVGGVFETTGSGTQYSEYGRMKSAGLEVYTDGNPYVMHHKVIIIDERIVILGSFNFSDNADKSNDENTLIIEDTVLAKAFKTEYDSILALAKNKK